MMIEIDRIIRNILTSNSIEITDFELTKNTRLREDLGMDSFNLAELTVHIEEEFGVDIFEDGLVNTIEEILQKIKGNE